MQHMCCSLKSTGLELTSGLAIRFLLFFFRFLHRCCCSCTFTALHIAGDIAIGVLSTGFTGFLRRQCRAQLPGLIIVYFRANPLCWLVMLSSSPLPTKRSAECDGDQCKECSMHLQWEGMLVQGLQHFVAELYATTVWLDRSA